ncbi:MAG TPA: DUF2721 domain-containing protein [Bacteroidales bacterium]|nr:DUF2721 domain-containing protein [Bacteroidales bacterium]
MMNPNSAQLINAMLVPAVMIIATAILIFSTNDKYSMIVNRIRLLKSESMRIGDYTVEKAEDKKRISNIELQISHLIHRISMVRIIILSYSTALVFFTVSAVLLAVRTDFQINGYYWVTIGFFFGGLLAILNGVVFSVIEIFKGYRIVQLEISEINYEEHKETL